ncbi:formate dehydrogenase (NAD+) [Phytophthora boehmeriae]|uniref:Formate dehydrogenase (NAD+) n=1 Tax=Phytophthora boehmeriae TaxID=109152 RepID=A0A8T1VGM8_9STRA|nr:formate dehydrogenase (NAD+) [Phytophthora boehmeriae]
MSEYTLCSIQSGRPLQDVIYLKDDEQSRHPCNSMDEEHRYEAENGDFCSTHFTVTQYEEAQSAKQVFDLVLSYICNIEKIDHTTIREDDGGDDKGVVQNRLVSTTYKNVKMESNTVMFSQYYDGTLDKRKCPGDSGYWLIVADFVDEDEQHPYLPDQRVRRDVNAVLEIREFVPQHPKSVAGGLPSCKPMVVLCRWVQNRMHYPSFPDCTEGWHELRMDLWGRALHHTIAENLRPRP